MFWEEWDVRTKFPVFFAIIFSNSHYNGLVETSIDSTLQKEKIIHELWLYCKYAY